MTASVQLRMHAPGDVDTGLTRPYRPAGGAATDHVFKILVTGPFAAGKTSLIQSVSQTPVVSTDVATSGDDLRVPLVVAVNRCDDADVATMLARSFGALSCEPVVACQLIDPESGRDVVIEALLTLLESMEGPPPGWHAEAVQMVGAL